MSLNKKLIDIENRLNTLKTRLDEVLSNKGATGGTTITESVAEVKNISASGGYDNLFEGLGYPKTPPIVQNAIDYGARIKTELDGKHADIYNKFMRDQNLVYFPVVEGGFSSARYACYGCSNLEEVPYFSADGNCESVFENCPKLTNIDGIDIGAVDARRAFAGCTGLTAIDNLEVRPCEILNSMFEGCTNLTNVNNILSDNVLYTGYMFKGCSSLTKAPNFSWDGSILAMQYMYEGCSSLTNVPYFGSDNCTNFEGMFKDCTKLQSVGTNGCRTPSATNMFYLFRNCRSLTTLPQLDTSNVIDMGTMCYNCTSLTDLSNITLDVSKIDNSDGEHGIKNLFRGCSNLTKAPIFTSNDIFISLESMFNGCRSLEEVGELNFTKVECVTGYFMYCYKLKKVGLVNLLNVNDFYGWVDGCSKLAYFNVINIGNTDGYFGNGFPFRGCSHWGDDNIVPGARETLTNSLIVNSIDRVAAGKSPVNIELSEFTKGLLTDDEKAAITAKGFTIV